MSVIEVKVPDIGDFDAVEVIEVLVKAGDTVEMEQSLIVLESDKASMDVPSSATGKVVEVKVKVGDKVGQGAVICTVEAQQAAAAPAPAQARLRRRRPHRPQRPQRPGPAPTAATHGGGADIQCEMLVLGAGPGGYSAAFRAADLGINTVLVERYSTLGGVCLNVGCIPSKALLHNAAVIDEAKALAAHGILFGEAKIDLDGLRHYKNQVVGKLTGGLAGMAKARKVQVVRGIGNFLDPHHLEVELTEGEGKRSTGKKTVIRFEKAIIAAGSQAVKLPFIPEDPRIVDSTARWNCPRSPTRCWSSAAALSASKWPRCTARWVPKSMSWKCSTA